MVENPSPRSWLGRLFPWMVVILATAQVAAMFLRSYEVLHDPTYLPGWDGSGYVRRGMAYFDAYRTGDLGEVWAWMTRPDIRPPAFGMLLGLWMMLRGDTPAAGIEWAQVAWFAGLILTVALGARLRVQGGLLAGAVAAVITAGTYDHLALVHAPMSESTSLLTVIGCTLGTLILINRGVAGALGIGVLMLLASMVRYNLGPMLLAPLLAWHVWEHRDNRKTLLDPKVILWGLPALVVFGGWQLMEPRLAEKVESFLVNRSSGLSFWSEAYLLFVPRAAVSDFYGWMGWPIQILAAVGLITVVWRRPVLGLQSSPELRLVQVQALAGFVALTLHDYKLARNLYTLVPLLVICAVAPFSALWTVQAGMSRRRQVLHVLVGLSLLGVMEGWWVQRYREGVPTLAKKYNMKGDPGVSQALDFLVRSAAEPEGNPRKRLWIMGVNDVVSTPLIEIWLREAALSVQLKAEAPPMVEKTRTGIDAGWSDAYGRYVTEEMMVPRIRDNTTFVTIETLPGTRRYKAGQRWTNYQNNYAVAFTQQEEVRLVEELVLDETGLRLRAWRSPDVALAAPTRAETPVTPTSPAFWKDNFGAGWSLVPADAPVELTRGERSLSLRLPTRVDAVQLCGPDIPVPPRFIGSIQLTTHNIAGRPLVVQLRGLAEGGAPNRVDGKGDIHRIGPIKPDAKQEIARLVELNPGSVEVRPCIVLNQTLGAVDLESLAFYPAADAAQVLEPTEQAAEGAGEQATETPGSL